jgi:hypothetical protein
LGRPGIPIRDPRRGFVLKDHLEIILDDLLFVRFVLKIINQKDVGILTCGFNTQSRTAIIKVICPIDVWLLGLSLQSGDSYRLRCFAIWVQKLLSNSKIF